MCCFNRQMPRVVNNCCTVIVPTVPMQAGMNGCSMGQPIGMATNCLNPNQVAAARSAAVAQANVVSGQCQEICNPQVEVVFEPAVCTAPNIFNHHRRIQHIVPVITEDIHQHHAHHEFVAKPQHGVRQTFDSDVSVGPPLMTQQMATPTIQPQQLAPFEIGGSFGVNPNQMDANCMVDTGAFASPAFTGC